MIRSHSQPSQRPHLLKIIPPFENSMVVKGDNIAWNNPWHYHPEFELLYCIRGKGTNFIGSSIRSIEEGELLLLGKNLPHTRHRTRGYYEANPEEEPESVVVQWREDFLGTNFFLVKEFVAIRQLMDRASRGLKFSHAVREQVAGRLMGLRELSATAAILEVLSILNQLAHTDEYEFINPLSYESHAHEESSQKINKVYHFTIEHFREPIRLSQVASLTGLTLASFCRYFKTRTRKSYVQYLTEIRVAYACDLLMNGDMDITRVCYESGFNNLSHFNKQFKQFSGTTPRQYRKQSARKVVI